MHVSCPDCATVYDVPDARLKPGRRLRCAQCRAEWAPIPAPQPEPAPAPAPEVPAAAEPPPEAPKPPPPISTAPALQAPAQQAAEAPAPDMPKPAPPTMGFAERPIRLIPPEHAQAYQSRLAVVPLVVAWALTIALVGAGGWGAYEYRGKVIQAWPPSQRAYAALGLN